MDFGILYTVDPVDRAIAGEGGRIPYQPCDVTRVVSFSHWKSRGSKCAKAWLPIMLLLTSGISWLSASPVAPADATITTTMTTTISTVTTSTGFVPNQLAGDPGCVSWGPSRIDCFSLGQDSAVWHDAYDPALWGGNHWSGWESRGTVGGGISFASGPTVSSWGLNRLDIFVRGSDNNLYHMSWDTNAWEPSWDNILGQPGGTMLAGDPGCVSWGPNRIDCFSLGQNGAVWHDAYDPALWGGNHWSGWESRGGSFASGPTVASWASNRLDIFVRGSDNNLYHMAWDTNAWESSWDNLLGQPAGTVNTTVTSTTSSTSTTTSTTTNIIQGADFTIMLSPSSLSISKGQSGTSQVTVQSSGSFSSDVSLSYTSSNPGITATFSKNTLHPSAGGQDSATLTVTVGSSSTSGSSTITVTGTAAGMPQRSATLTIAVCLIATATYGSELAPEVQLLRNFRDNAILKTQAGSNFMVAFNAWYYSFSPQVAVYIATHSVERTIMKGVLYPLIGILALSSGTFSATSSYPELAALLSGLVASSLVGAFYLGLPLSLLRAKIRRLSGRRAQRLVESSLGFALLGGIGALLIGEMFASSIVLMVSSSDIVLSALFLSAAFTSAKIAKKLQAP